jgi:hypothetical protein
MTFIASTSGGCCSTAIAWAPVSPSRAPTDFDYTAEPSRDQNESRSLILPTREAGPFGIALFTFDW